MVSEQELISPLVVAYGGGTNSTAMLCGFRERGIVPQLILFADTGGEMPHTYAHIKDMDGMCKAWFGVGIEVVRAKYRGKFEGLEKECNRKMALPSLAYGMKTCSQKHKLAPQHRRIKEWLSQTGNDHCTLAVGFDAGERHRVKEYPEMWRKNWFPLVEWGWLREECIDAIRRHNLPQPGKSSCFFCPAMKRHEIIKLAKDHPDLFARAVAMEIAANGTGGANKTKRGLTGRSLMWSDIVNQDDAQGKLWEYLDQNDPNPIPCGCFDGE